nr:very short patch repair endonuclease [Aureimonas sp. ME7]
MTDSSTPAVDPKRSKLMARVRQKDTTPEMALRRTLHRLRYRFRIHVRTLPGTPDIVFPSRRKAIFVHGCFWHRHAGCHKMTTPKTRVEFWQAKFDRNVERDASVVRMLEDMGWSVLTIWECQTEVEDEMRRLATDFLGPPGGCKVFPRSVG